jgi:NAD+ synthase (glutamine-hydrolysing)
MPSSSQNTHVAAISLNQTVGDWAGNSRRIIEALACARQRGATLIVFPEMCISGYSLGDRLFMGSTTTRSWLALKSLLPFTKGVVAMLGLPVRHRDVLYNAVAVVANEQIVGIVPKENLANGDVQYEQRWFGAWPRGLVEEFTCPDGTGIPIGALLFEASGIGRFALEICEDGWKGLRPGSVHALAGAHIVANPSASWFTLGKHRIRKQMVTQISREDHVAYIYASSMGCDATRLVFDGSTFIAVNGDVLAEGRRFVFKDEFEIIDRVIDISHLERVRSSEGSWRQQVESIQSTATSSAKGLVTIEGDFPTSKSAPAPDAYWEPSTRASDHDQSLDWLYEAQLIPQRPQSKDHAFLELELALAMGLREYTSKTKIPGFALALSGGRDSAMCAILVARMFQYHHPDLKGEDLKSCVHKGLCTAYMATEHSSSATENAAYALAEELGAHHTRIDIQEALNRQLALTPDLVGHTLNWENDGDDIPLQNMQARLRGSLIWILANTRGFVLLTTSNKSEAAVGYATMDGDTNGGLAPLADVPKSLVNLWLDWAKDFYGMQSLEGILATPATAELRPADRHQTDEDDLMPYDILDRLMAHFIQHGQDPVEMFEHLWPLMSTRFDGNAQAFANTIRRFISLFCRAQWKRERLAIGFRVTAFDLDPKSGLRFPPVQAPFTEELAELDALVAKKYTP